MSAPHACPPPSHAREPGFLLAMQTHAIAERVQAHLAHDATLLELVPDYVRWKERDGSLVGYRAVVRREATIDHTYVTIRTAAPARLADEAERLHHRADEDHAGLRAFAFLPADQLLLLAFPIDRAMHDLRRLVRASKVRSLVAACCPQLVPDRCRFSKSRSLHELVRYKPERRAVLRWRVGLVDKVGPAVHHTSIWVRCHAEAQAPRTLAATNAAATGGVACPQTLGIAHDRLLIESHVEGRTWSPFLEPDADDTTKAAMVVARLHDAAAPDKLPQHNALTELDLVLVTAEDLGNLDPRLGTLATALADRLSRDVPQARPLVLAHGDLHPNQVLLRDDDAGLCDFDRACLAPAAHDLATLLAQCVERDLQAGPPIGRAFIEAYGRHRALPDREEIAWWTACALVRNATRPFRRLRPDWRAAAAALLQRADRALERTNVEDTWS